MSQVKENLIEILANDKEEKFFLTEEEEKELLETLPLMDEKFEAIFLEF